MIFTIRVFMKIFEFFLASTGAFDPSEIFSIVQDIRECSKMTIKPNNYRKSTALFVPDICYSEKSFSGTSNVAFRINITKKYESHSQIWSINYFSSFLKNLELKSNQIEASGFDPEHQVNRRSVLHHQFFAVVNDGCSKPCQKRKLYAEARVSS